MGNSKEPLHTALKTAAIRENGAYWLVIIALLLQFIISSICLYLNCNCLVFDGFRKGVERSYSPNGEYYIVRYISRMRFTLFYLVDPLGRADLYDRVGNLLYSGSAMVDDGAGPTWAGSLCQGANSANWVGFMGNAGEGPDWSYDLPTPPGNARPVPGCASNDAVRTPT